MTGTCVNCNTSETELNEEAKCVNCSATGADTGADTGASEGTLGGAEETMPNTGTEDGAASGTPEEGTL